jgi:hypothetical protein
MNPPIMLLTVLAFGFTGLIAPELQKAQEKAQERREASMKAYDEWNHEQNVIQEQLEQEREMLRTGSVHAVPVTSVEWLKYICERNKGTFSKKEDPEWNHDYFILYCKGVMG